MIKMRPEKLPRALRGEAARTRQAIKIGAHAAAQRFKARLVARTDELGITDRGILKNSWRASAGGGRDTAGRFMAANGVLAQVYSDAPHAGVVELGARPHAVSAEGLEAIKQWAMRKLGLDEKQAEAAAHGIAKKLALVGQKPRYLVRDVLPDARRYLAEEISRVMTSSPPRSGGES